jgi:hypothetical protein
MKTNYHLTPFEEKTLETISKSLDELQKAISSHVQPLSSKERRKLFKMGDKTLAFVKKCYEFSQQNPELCPKYFDMVTFETGYNDAYNLYAAVNMATQLRENLVDTQMRAGSDALQTALIFYNSVKAAATNGIVGAKVIYEELRKRFPGGRRRKEPEENNPSQPNDLAG